MKLYSRIWKTTSQRPPDSLPKLVLLHGMAGTGALWQPIATCLKNTMTLLACDQRGHGESLTSQDPHCSLTCTPLDYGQDVIDTLTAAQFHPTWILGHSMGVRSAVAAAHLKPEWIQGLILVDLGFSGLAQGSFGKHLEPFLKILPQTFTSREEAKTFLTTHAPDPSIMKYLLAVSQKDDQDHVWFPFETTVLIATLQAAYHFSIRPWIENLAQKKCPS